MNSISSNLNIMIKAAEKASKVIIRDFGELEKLQVLSKGPSDFVTNSDKKAEKIIIEELAKYKKKFSLNQKNNLTDQIMNFKKEMKINYNLKNFNITKKYFNKITQSTSGTLENDPIYKNKLDIKEILEQSI